jgi:drug/metabolite transporter (DMT)-like permease
LATSRKVLFSYAVFGASALIWGVNWPIMKVAVGLMAPLWFATARVAFGCLSAFLFLAVLDRLHWPARADWPIILSVGILQLAGAQMLIHAGLAYLPAGKSAILAYSTPLWVLPGAWAFLGERLTRASKAGLACGMAGLLILVDPMGLLAHWRGNLLLLLASLAWAAAILHSRAHRWHLQPEHVLPWQLLVGTLVMAPIAYAVAGPVHLSLSQNLSIILLYNGPLATAFAVWGMVNAQKNLPAITSSLVFLIVPVIGLGAATWALGEEPSIAEWLGFFLIILGVGLSALASVSGRFRVGAKRIDLPRFRS